MVRSDLAAAVRRDHPELDKRAAEAIVDTFFDAIVTRLAAGGRIELRDFGMFSTRQREGRVGRNPLTGKVAQVARKRAIYFKPGRNLAKRINWSNL